MSYNKIGDGLAFWLATFFFINLASIPLAIWKLIDIVVWVCGHVKVSMQ